MQRLLLVFRSNWISRIGAVVTTLAFMGIVSFFLLSAFGVGGPYMGLITFLVLPGIFVMGLLLIPAGLILYRKTLKARMAGLEGKPMHLARVIGSLTAVNVLVVGIAGYQGLHYMDSVEFCGTVCHEVMQPQFEAYRESPHARVGCVDCHIGPGASWFVKSKLSGLRQVFAVMFDSFQRPIPTPVHDLRPARDTCEQCHWPDQFKGDKLVYRHHFLADRENTKKTNVLVVKTGGTRPDGKPTGVHWHVHDGVEVSYYAEDRKRTSIPWVKLVNHETGESEVFVREGFEGEPDPEKLRTMDCLDCHNQPSHVYERAPAALNEAMATGSVSPSIPFIKKKSYEALMEDWTSREEAEAGIRRMLTEFYADEEPLDEATKALLEPAIVAIQAIWRRNIYPGMGIDWDTYRSFDDHYGCFRCHGGEHRNERGREISTDCENCHVVLSYREENPPILKSLGLGD